MPSLVPVEIENGDDQVQQKMSQMSIESVQAPFKPETSVAPECALNVEAKQEKLTVDENVETPVLLGNEVDSSYIEAPLLPGPFKEPRKKQKKSVR